MSTTGPTAGHPPQGAAPQQGPPPSGGVPAASRGPRRNGQLEADPGWYPDPANDRDTFRWWTGEAWTAWLTTDPTADPPPHRRPDLGPLAAAETPGAPRGRFGTAPKLVMGLVTLAVLIAGIVVVGWPHRARAELGRAGPVTSYRPPDLSVRCGDTWTVGGEVSVLLAEGFAIDGPVRGSTLGNLQCAANLRDEDANNLLALGLADIRESESPQFHAENAVDLLREHLYRSGPASLHDVVSEPAPGLDRAWRVTGYLLPDGGTVKDHLEVVVLDLSSGHRAVWIQLVGDNVSPTNKKILAQARETLKRV